MQLAVAGEAGWSEQNAGGTPALLRGGLRGGGGGWRWGYGETFVSVETVGGGGDEGHGADEVVGDAEVEAKGVGGNVGGDLGVDAFAGKGCGEVLLLIAGETFPDFILLFAGVE